MELRIKDYSSPNDRVEISLQMTDEGDVDILANDYFLCRIDKTLGKLVLYTGLDAVELGVKLDDDGCIAVTMEGTS